MTDAANATPKVPAEPVQVGDWRLDVRRNELRRGAETVHLEPKAAEVLACLAAAPGEVVSREALLGAVWPGVVVGDDTLTQAIIKLRKALGDEAHAPRYIETISKRGYRLVAPAVAPSPEAPPPTRSRHWAWAMGAAACIAVGAGFYFAASQRPWPLASPAAEKARPASIPTVAILPLANLSGDPAREYFSDGITEDMINALGRFSGVRVMSAGAVQGYKGKSGSPRQVRDELGARYVVQGSVRESAGQVRVTVALSDGETGTQLWSERHDGEGTQLFAIQDRIARDIVGALQVKLGQLEEQRSVATPAASLEAHDLVLRARERINRTTRNANREARELLARAAQLAPDYAEVHTELGRAEYQRVTNGWVEDAAASLARVESMARKALASPDTRTHARAHSLLAALYSQQERYAEALAQADQAIALNPSESMALYWRGNALVAGGRIEEAIGVLETARRFEPYPTAGQGVHLAVAYYLAGRYAEALAQADALLARASRQTTLRAVRAAALAQSGRAEEARREALEIRRMDPLFDPEAFGAYLAEPAQHAALREGLRKAGL